MINRLRSLRPNRVAAFLGTLAALLGALAPAVANLDLSSTAGVIAGVVAVVTIVVKYLTGWQRYEAVQHYLAATTDLAPEHVDG